MGIPMRFYRTAALATLSLAGVLASAETEGRERRQRGERVGAPIRGLERAERFEGGGLVQYDPGLPDGTRFTDQGFSWLGNLFDTRSGSPLGPGTITQIQWYNGQTNPTDNYLVIFPQSGPDYGGFVGSVDSFAFNTYNLIHGPVTAPVFVGFYAADQPATPVSLGYANGSYNGQGFHASQRTFFDSAGETIPGMNIVLRISGSLIIPVELLEFEVE